MLYNQWLSGTCCIVFVVYISNDVDVMRYRIEQVAVGNAILTLTSMVALINKAMFTILATCLHSIPARCSHIQVAHYCFSCKL
jgi:hypothetical protein